MFPFYCPLPSSVDSIKIHGCPKINLAAFFNSPHPEETVIKIVLGKKFYQTLKTCML